MVWATYVRRAPDESWRLEAVSVVSADRARALAEQNHARCRAAGVELLVRVCESMQAVPWTLDPGDAPAARA
jgi:hypothetical protein